MKVFVNNISFKLTLEGIPFSTFSGSKFVPLVGVVVGVAVAPLVDVVVP